MAQIKMPLEKDRHGKQTEQCVLAIIQKRIRIICQFMAAEIEIDLKEQICECTRDT